MKVLMAPVNIAGQPILAVRELRRQGVDATLLQYAAGNRHPFGYESDRIVNLRGKHRLETQAQALKDALDEGYDIFHFWMGPMFLATGFGGLYGADLPYIKVRGRRIVYRGTGFDLRTRALHSERNPYNAYRYGFEGTVDEDTHFAFLDYLKDYVDQFIVQDPEMHEHMPQAKVVPRGIELDQWEEVGIDPNDRPLVVHAPSKVRVKGTEFVLKAVEELQAEGVPFDFQLIQGMGHEEAREWYRKADVVVDQLLIGWYGVLTIEGLALGKPVLAYVRDDLYDSFTPEIPIHNANPDTIKERLRELVTDFELRRSLAERGRSFVEHVHDIRDVAAKLRDIYGEVLNRPIRLPESFADLDFLVGRYKEVEAMDARVKARQFDRLLPELKQLRYRSRKYEEMRELLPKARRWDRFISELGAPTVEGAQLRLAWAIASMKYKSRSEQELLVEVEDLRRSVRLLREAEVADKEPRGLRSRLRFLSRSRHRPEDIARIAPILRAQRRAQGRAPDDLSELRFKAKQRDDLLDTLKELKYKANKYDQLKAEVAQLRAKANRYDRLVELDAEAKARRYDRFVAELESPTLEGARLRLAWAVSSMKYKSKSRAELEAEIAGLRQRVVALEQGQEQGPDGSERPRATVEGS